MKQLLLTLLIALPISLKAAVLTIETREVKNFDSPATDPFQVGQVIAMAKEVVALGEQIYHLIQKGKPSATTNYSPISIVPRDPLTKEIVDPFDMDDCSMPTQRKFTTSVKRGNEELVKFQYMVIYTYGCSYNDKGKYIQAAMVQPVALKAAYGWDVNATMKLQAVMNHGKKADPIVGAMLTLKYSMTSWHTVYEHNDTLHITGAGEIKSYSK